MREFAHRATPSSLPLLGKRTPISALSFSPDTLHLATATSTGQITMWELDESQHIPLKVAHVYQLPTSWLGDDISQTMRENMQVVETKLEELCTSVLAQENAPKL